MTVTSVSLAMELVRRSPRSSLRRPARTMPTQTPTAVKAALMRPVRRPRYALPAMTTMKTTSSQFTASLFSPLRLL